MKLSKQRVAAVGVLGVAVLALGADRFVLGTSISGPAAADAAEALVPAAAPLRLAETTPGTESPLPATKAEVESVASRLRSDAALPAATEDVAEANAIRADDALVIPSGWLPKVAVETAADTTPKSKVPEALTSFNAKITAILGTQDAPVVQIAIENGTRRTVELGQRVGELELLRVNLKQRTAVFGMNGFEKTLTWGTSNER